MKKKPNIIIVVVLTVISTLVSLTRNVPLSNGSDGFGSNRKAYLDQKERERKRIEHAR